jgi:hypothetical protein
MKIHFVENAVGLVFKQEQSPSSFYFLQARAYSDSLRGLWYSLCTEVSAHVAWVHLHLHLHLQPRLTSSADNMSAMSCPPQWPNEVRNLLWYHLWLPRQLDSRFIFCAIVHCIQVALRYAPVQILGRGRFGCVYMAKEKSTWNQAYGILPSQHRKTFWRLRASRWQQSLHLHEGLGSLSCPWSASDLHFEAQGFARTTYCTKDFKPAREYSCLSSWTELFIVISILWVEQFNTSVESELHHNCPHNHNTKCCLCCI